MIPEERFQEMKEIGLASLVLAIAFSLSISGGLFSIFSITWEMVIISFIVVSTGFILHELGHKFTAIKSGYYAEFRIWKIGIYITLLSSMFGFIFAAPGAVYIMPKYDIYGNAKQITKENSGLAAVTGPLVNLILAGVFFMISGINFSFLGIPMAQIAGLGIQINLWLAIFNMIPFPPLDGYKVFTWDKNIWIAVFGTCFIVIYWNVFRVLYSLVIFPYFPALS